MARCRYLNSVCRSMAATAVGVTMVSISVEPIETASAQQYPVWTRTEGQLYSNVQEEGHSRVDGMGDPKQLSAPAQASDVFPYFVQLEQHISSCAFVRLLRPLTQGHTHCLCSGRLVRVYLYPGGAFAADPRWRLFRTC